MANDETDGGGKSSSGPYVGFPSYKNMIGGFKQIILPDRIDRSVLRGFSGVVGSQLMSTLRFFSHINKSGQPTDHLRKLVEAHGTDAWAEELEAQLRRAYAPLFDLNLASASPNQFTEKFRASFPAEGDTLRKAMTFFLNATRETKIVVSPLVMSGKKPRSNGTKKPKQAKAQQKPAGDNAGAGGGQHGKHHEDPPAHDDFKKDLLGKFPAFDPAWPDNIKADWFKGFQQFMEMAKK